MTPFGHEPVMLAEVVRAMAPEDGELYVDCTLGGGGHTRALLDAADCRVVGIDRDPAALAAASQWVGAARERLEPVRGSFSQLPEILDGLGVQHVHGIFADLGVSSHQLDTAERGFSFRRAGPVDMRMDPDGARSAAQLIEQGTEAELADVIYRYGEERRSRRVARAIVAGRPWDDTVALAEAVARAVGGRGGRTHPATRTFQALRIAVNEELAELESLLHVAPSKLLTGGRLAFLTFHSLEDRMVKRAFAEAAGRNAPRDPYGNPVGATTLKLASSRPPSADDPNPRARSARLRSATRLPWNES